MSNYDDFLLKNFKNDFKIAVKNKIQGVQRIDTLDFYISTFIAPLGA